MPDVTIDIIPAAVMLFWAVRIFLRKDISKSQMLMTAGMLVAAHAIFFWRESAVFVFPFVLLSIREATVNGGISKWDWLVFIPSIVFSALDSSPAYDIFLCIQVIAILIWSSVEVHRYNKLSAEYYDISDDSAEVPDQVLLFLYASTAVAAVIIILPDGIRFYKEVTLFLVLFLSVMLYMLGRNVNKLGRQPKVPDETDEIDEPDKTGEPYVIEKPSDTPEETVEGSEADRKLLQRVMDEKMFLDPGISLVSLAEALHTNRTYLSNSIHACYNRNFSDFINRLRVDYALDLMRTEMPDVNIKDVAMRSGYNNLQSFYRNFTQIMEMSPGTWLEKNDKQ